MANDTQRWAAVQLQRIRNDQGEYEYRRSKLRAQQDADFAQGLADTAQHGRLMSGPGALGADLGLAALGFAGPPGALASTIGFGALGAARMAEGFKRREEGLPGTTAEIGWGALDVGAPFIGKAYRGIKSLLPKKPPKPPIQRGTVADFRWPADKPLLVKRTQDKKAVVEDLNKPLEVEPKSPGMDELVPSALEDWTDWSAPGSRQPMVAPGRGRYAPRERGGTGTGRGRRVAFGGLKHKIDLSDPQSFVHLPDEIPGRPHYFGGKPLPIAKGAEGLNIDRPLVAAGRAQDFPFDPSLTGAARAAALPTRTPRGLRQWDQVQEPLTTSDPRQGLGSIPSRGPSGDLTKMGPDSARARQQAGGDEVPLAGGPIDIAGQRGRPGAPKPEPRDAKAAAEKFGSIDDAYDAVERARRQQRISPASKPRMMGPLLPPFDPSRALPAAIRKLQNLIANKYEYVRFRADKDANGQMLDEWEGWVERRTAKRGHPLDSKGGGAVPFERTIHSPFDIERAGSPRVTTTDPFEYYGVDVPRGMDTPPQGAGGRPRSPLVSGDSRSVGGDPTDTSSPFDNMLDKLDETPVVPPVDAAKDAASAVSGAMPASVVRRFQSQIDRLQREKDRLVDDFRQHSRREYEAVIFKPGDSLPTPALTRAEMKLHQQKIAQLESRQEVLRQRMQGKAPYVASPDEYGQMERRLKRLLTQRGSIRKVGYGFDPTDMQEQLFKNEQAVETLLAKMKAHPLGAGLPDAAVFLKRRSSLSPNQASPYTHFSNAAEQARQPQGEPVTGMAEGALNMSDKQAKTLYAQGAESCFLPRHLIQGD